MYITTRLFPQLGIGDAMSPKITNGGAEQVAQGATEIAILPVSELLRKSGTDYVGMIPKEIQFASMFSAAMLVGSKEGDGSRRLIAFLASADEKKAIRNSGMEPLGPR
jgi:molybdate transport system substrate-binding protein